MDRVRHIDRLDHEQCRVENELRQKDRPQQRMSQDERGAFAYFDERMTRRTDRGIGFVDAGEENHCARRQQGRDRDRQAAAIQPTSAPPSAGPAANAVVRASSIRPLATGSASDSTSAGTSAGAATLNATVPHAPMKPSTASSSRFNPPSVTNARMTSRE